MPLKVGILGFGRIGRAIFRHIENLSQMSVNTIIDINPDLKNIEYLLNFDSIMGIRNSSKKFRISGQTLINDQDVVVDYHVSQNVLPKHVKGLDVLIDSSGVTRPSDYYSEILEANKNLRIFITHCNDAFGEALVMGANDRSKNWTEQRVVSSSICDATAVAPVLTCLHDNFGINFLHLTTVHPWLNYQNLLDGPSTSWANPGETFHHYPLGRAAPDVLIPKPTTALQATLASMENVDFEASSFSYRVPTSIVGSADLQIQLKNIPESINEINQKFENFISKDGKKILGINYDPLISKDFLCREESAIIDARWTSLVNNNLHLVLWYDNENGYSKKVIDQILWISSS